MRFLRPLLSSGLACLLALIVWQGLLIATADFLAPPGRETVSFALEAIATNNQSAPPSLLLLGDSTAVFNYSAALLPRTLSLAMFSAGFAESHHALLRYLANKPPPACMILSSSFAWDYHRRHGFWDLYVAGGFYSWSELAALHRESASVAGWPASEHSLPGFLLRAGLYRFGLLGIGAGAPLENRAAHAWLRERLLAGNGTVNKDEMTYPFLSESEDHLRKPFAPSPVSELYLRRLLNLAASKNIRVLWLQPPVSGQVLHPVGQEYYTAQASWLARHLLAHPGNAAFTNPESYPDSLFFSATHLNKSGVARFHESVSKLAASCLP